MQFVESSPLGARSARWSFVSRTTPVRVTLFPMVHVGEAAFYEATYADAAAHDVVLLEGVNSPVVKRITRSYRWVVGSRAMRGLVVQPRFPAGEARARVVRADLSGDEFEAEWRAVPLWLRTAVYVLAPIMGLRRRWFYSKAKLVKGMGTEDQPSYAELLAFSPQTGPLTRAIREARDARLIERLGVELDTSPARPLSLAIIYGAGHMRAVVRELTTNRDFVVSDAEWRTIITGD